MCMEIGELTGQTAILESQVRFIKTQENDEIPARHLKIRCVCMKLINMKYAYRCLYCEIFYCRECAEQHFGKTVDESRAERDT